MNPTTATLISAAGFILAVFGASWLNQQAMNKRIDDLKTYLDARFEAMNARFDGVDQRFSALEQRVDRIERQLEAIFKPILPKS